MPRPPLPILVLRDAVVVLVAIVVGGWIGALPYDTGGADARVVQAFQGVAGTLGFAAAGHLASARRPLRLTLVTLVVWLLAGVQVASAGMHPSWWLLLLAVLALMATLGGGLALLLERLARE